MTVAENPGGYQNLHHKADFVFTIRVTKRLLSPIGIWPLDRGDSFRGDFRSITYVGIIFVLMCFLMVPHVIYTFHDCEDLTRYMKVMAAQVFNIVGIIKFCMMIIRKKRIRECLTEMELHYIDVESEEDRLVMKNVDKIARVFTTIYLCFSFGCALPYHIILPLLSKRVVKSDNTTQIPLPYLSNYVFFVIEDSPAYEITFCSQYVISTVILFINSGTNSLVAIMTMHSCGMFEVVNRRLKSLFHRDSDDIKGCLRDIVRHHVKAITFADLIETNLNAMLLMEMVTCTFIICFVEYGVIMEWEDKNIFNMVSYFLLLVWMFLNVYILSYIGDYMKRESEKVRFTSYYMPWYNYSKEVNTNLNIIMLRPLRPTSFTAAKFFDLSFPAFCDVVKTSAAYMNFLRTMAE